MKVEFKTAYGYQGNAMALPVASVDRAIPFYETVLGFRVVSRRDEPHCSVVLERDAIQIGLAENGGDPSQDGCAFEVNDAEAALAEFQAHGLNKADSGFGVEAHGESSFKVFYVVAPDGLCYWFGERQAAKPAGA